MAKIKLSDNIQYLKGVGEKSAKLFSHLGIHTINDLLCHYPYKYIDYTSPCCVAAAPYGEPCVVKAQVYGKVSTLIKGGRKICRVTAGDDTAGLVITFFSPYAAASLQEGKAYFFYGKVTGGFTQKMMSSPDFISVDSPKPLTPIYHLTKGISNNYLQKCVKTALGMVEKPICEPLPQNLIEDYRLMSYQNAVEAIHMPKTAQEAEKAKKRLVFDELLVMQLGLLQLKSQNKVQLSTKIICKAINEFYAAIPFLPTNAQKTAISEMCTDFCGKTPMNRLLQGDVGSGKTLVAAAGMFLAAKNGFQSVLMAPTEILAVQHAETLQKLLKPFGIAIALLTGSVKGKAKKLLLEKIENGEVQLVVGTHAVLSDNVRFDNLAFAVTDEQHRFGVRQRGQLQNKAEKPPHILVMSATPIPRTLGLLMFGDLDISILDELPKGRQAVKTYLVDSQKRQRMFGFIQKHCAEGRQAFIVCPLIEDEGNTSDMQAVTTYFEQVAQPLLPSLRVALLHGKMKGEQKSEIMKAFLNKEYDVLCSTTVIEVGVDVPNANIMVIENAERYGLSALHQLRGRVGRGTHESFCILVSDHNGEAAQQRLRYLCTTSDGFDIAQYDMQTRGVGDFFGNRQHGLPTLKIANLMGDSKVLYITQAEANKMVEKDAELSEYPALKQRVSQFFSQETAFN